MKDTCYLIVTPKGIDRMVKTSRSATDLRKNEIPIKLNLQVDSDNWQPPFIEKTIAVDRWDRGVDIDDVDFENDFVTEEEAQKIRQMRLEKMRDVLQSQGYTVTKNTEETDA